MPKQSGSDEGRELYPLDTNLLKTPVAGIGVQLHFNFQLLELKHRQVQTAGNHFTGMVSGLRPRFFLIVWSLAIGLAWLILALSVDDALLILGTRRAKTARQNCILVRYSVFWPVCNHSVDCLAWSEHPVTRREALVNLQLILRCAVKHLTSVT